MKKLNKKGSSLVELIISITLVAVTVIYFSRTLVVVKNLYTDTKIETKRYVDENYNYRILSYIKKKNGIDAPINKGNVNIEGYDVTNSNQSLRNYVNPGSDKFKVYEVSFNLNGGTYYYYYVK